MQGLSRVWVNNFSGGESWSTQGNLWRHMDQNRKGGCRYPSLWQTLPLENTDRSLFKTLQLILKLNLWRWNIFKTRRVVNKNPDKRLKCPPHHQQSKRTQIQWIYTIFTVIATKYNVNIKFVPDACLIDKSVKFLWRKTKAHKKYIFLPWRSVQPWGHTLGRTCRGSPPRHQLASLFSSCLKAGPVKHKETNNLPQPQQKL